jgi:hypothetical protein
MMRFTGARRLAGAVALVVLIAAANSLFAGQGVYAP